MIRAVLFDLGGVIIRSPLEAFARYEREGGLPVGFLSTLLRQNPDGNAWARHERGEVTGDVFATLFEAEARAAGHPVDARSVIALMHGGVHPDMPPAIRRIREHGLRIALVTNNFPGSDTVGSLARPEVAEIVAMVDVVIESSREGVRKPEPAFYALACSRLDIEPAEAVFLDDLGINLKPAREMGMTTIKAVDPVQALRELGEVLQLELVDIDSTSGSLLDQR